MLPRIHFIASTILAFLLWPFLGFWGLGIYIGGFFVDFDHYLIYVFRKKNLDLTKSIKYFQEGHKAGLYIFHTIETIILLLILIPYHILFFSVLLGLILHLMMDWFYEIKKYKKIKPLSITYYLIRKRF